MLQFLFCLSLAFGTTSDYAHSITVEGRDLFDAHAHMLDLMRAEYGDGVKVTVTSWTYRERSGGRWVLAATTLDPVSRKMLQPCEHECMPGM